MSLNMLKKSAVANGVSYCSPKTNLICKIVERFDTLTVNFDQVLSLDNHMNTPGNKSNSCFHNFYHSHFSLVDAVSKYWYQYEEHHKYLHWQNKIVITLLRYAMINCYHLLLTKKNYEKPLFRKNLAIYFMTQ